MVQGTYADTCYIEPKLVDLGKATEVISFLPWGYFLDGVWVFPLIWFWK